MKSLLRRIAASAVAVGAALPAVAGDTGQDAPFVDFSRPDRVVEIGLHVGEGASTITQNYATAIPDVADFSLTPGSMTTFGASAELPVRNFFAIGTGLDFAINNFYYSMTILHPSEGTLNSLYTRNHFYTLEVPLYLGFRFNLGSHVKWNSEIGGYLSFGAGGKTRTRAYTSSTNSLGQSQVTQTNYERNYFNDDNPIINGVTGTDWGLHLGTGILVNRHWSVKAVMHAGARDLAKNYGVLGISTHTLNVVFKAGYIF